MNKLTFILVVVALFIFASCDSVTRKADKYAKDFAEASVLLNYTEAQNVKKEAYEYRSSLSKEEKEIFDGRFLYAIEIYTDKYVEKLEEGTNSTGKMIDSSFDQIQKKNDIVYKLDDEKSDN